MATPYQRGHRFERTVEDALARRGWRVVRSAGSRGPIDLVAWLPHHPPTSSRRAWPSLRRIVAVQCKRHGAITARESEALRDACRGLTTEAYVIRSNRRHLEVRLVSSAMPTSWEAFADVF